jgi:uncharacterized membrane-anchored protein YitT (DUF2179 family)
MTINQNERLLRSDLKPGPVGSVATSVAASSGSGVRAWRWLWTDLVLIAAGSIIFVIGLNTILVQHRLIAGGLAGAAILMNHLQPRLEIGWWYLLLNLPLIWLGWRRVGRRFMLLTIFGMVFFSLAAVWIKPPALAVEDPLLALLAAGVVCGLGAGLVLRSHGSAGGLDILSVYLKNRFGFSVGTVGFALNALLLAVGVWLYSLEAALYSALFLFVCSRVVDAVMAGVNPPRVMLVISDRADAVGQALLQQNSCRITYLKGEGGYSRGEKKIIYSVAPLMEIPRLKACVLNEDPEAFVVVNAACEVTQRKTFAGISPSGKTATYLERI